MLGRPKRGSVVVDTAGGDAGGARRFRDELDAYLTLRGPEVVVIGRGRRVDARWMIKREAEALRHRPRRVVATNNACFTSAGTERWVLLRNALNFLTRQDHAALPAHVRPRPDWDSIVMRKLLWRADVVVVPSTSMAERVIHQVPSIRSRLVVRAHPVRPRGDHDEDRVRGRVICPVAFDRHKAMPRRSAVLDVAARHVRAMMPELHILMTADGADLEGAGIVTDSPLKPVGRMSTSTLNNLLPSGQVIIFPPTLEAFGFPLAEARVNGQPVVAADTLHNAEIAGPLLVGCDLDDPHSLAAALIRALSQPPLTERSNPFDTIAYFDWLLGPDTPTPTH